MARQKTIPGTDHDRIKPLDDKGEAYCIEMQKRVKQSAKEKAAKQDLIEEMKKHGQTTYRLGDGRIITLASKDNVRVTEVEDGEETPDAA